MFDLTIIIIIMDTVKLLFGNYNDKQHLTAEFIISNI